MCVVVTSDHKQRKKSCHMCHLQFAFESCVGRGCLMVTAVFNGGGNGQQQGIGKAGGRQATQQEGMVDDVGQAGSRQHGKRGG
jgi:hypothetical protein